MPAIARRRFRAFLLCANQALADLEEATGKPVMVVEAPELNVLVTIRRVGPVDVGFGGGAIEVTWEPQSGQVPARATITADLEAGPPRPRQFRRCAPG